MKTRKTKTIVLDILDKDGNQIASMSAHVRCGRGASISVEIFNAEAVSQEMEAFEAEKAAFRAEAEALAAAEGAVLA